MIGIIPAGGKGLRFRELGAQYPKAILPYKEKPILIHQIEWMAKHGVTEVKIVANPKTTPQFEQILQFYKLPLPVEIVEQTVQNGLSGAVYEALNTSPASRCLVVLGDILPDQEIPHQYLTTGNAISVKYVNDYSRWCMVSIDPNSNVIDFYDKPTKRPDTEYAVSGVYILEDSKQVKELIELQFEHNITINNEYQFSTVLSSIGEAASIGTFELDLIDFGTLDEFLKNRSIKNSRSFNDIYIDGNLVVKSSDTNGSKLIDEVNWYNNIPNELKPYTPRIIDYDFYGPAVEYVMERVDAITLRDLFLFIDGSEETWHEIFDQLTDVLDLMITDGRPNNFLRQVYQKTQERVNDIDIPIEYQLVREFLRDFKILIEDPEFELDCVMHGDFCFSNIMYNTQTKKITMIDPRGQLFGNHYYEIAKLCHSVLYDYDFIDTELYLRSNDDEIELYNNGKEPIQRIFMQYLDERYDSNELYFINMLTASLFLSMIPLHNHNTTNQKLYYEKFKQIYSSQK